MRFELWIFKSKLISVSYGYLSFPFDLLHQKWLTSMDFQTANIYFYFKSCKRRNTELIHIWTRSAERKNFHFLSVFQRTYFHVLFDLCFSQQTFTLRKIYHSLVILVQLPFTNTTHSPCNGTRSVLPLDQCPSSVCELSSPCDFISHTTTHLQPPFSWHLVNEGLGHNCEGFYLNWRKALSISMSK